MKALVIPDVHLKPYMFKEAAEWMRKGVADRAVCLMDIPDDWNREYDIELYAQTFDAAISFAKEFPDTLWCYGNHDLCYLWNERESGYSRAAAYMVRNKLEELKEALPAGNQIRYIQRIDDVLFCHGGILQAFVEENVKNTDSVDQIIAEINTMGPEQLWSNASPIWYRPQYHQETMYEEDSLLQVVGHTPVEKIYRSTNVISCDVFSTYRDGHPIGTQKYPVIDTVEKILWKEV